MWICQLRISLSIRPLIAKKEFAFYLNFVLFLFPPVVVVGSFFRPTIYRITFRGHIHSAFLTFLIFIPALFGEEYNLATDVQWGFRIRSQPAATTGNNGP